MTNMLVWLWLAVICLACAAHQRPRDHVNATGAPISQSQGDVSCHNVDDQLASLYQMFWNWNLAHNPQSATNAGVHMHNAKLDSYLLESFATGMRVVSWFHRRAKQFETCAIRHWRTFHHLQLFIDYLEAYCRFYQHQEYLLPISNFDGPQLSLMASINTMPHTTEQDYRNIIRRLAGVFQQVEDTIQLLKLGIEKGIVHHQSAMSDVLNQLAELQNRNIDENGLYAPFRSLMESGSPFISAAKRQKLARAAFNIIYYQILPSLGQLENFLRDVYLKNLRPGVGLSSLPQGKEYYESKIKYYTDSAYTAQQIHQFGLGDMERLQTEIMQNLRHEGYHGTLRDYLESIRDEPTAIGREAEALRQVNDLVKGRIAAKMDLVVKNISSIGLNIAQNVVSWKNSPTGLYEPPTVDGKKAATFHINMATFQPGVEYLTVTLALHEALPGHHYEQCYLMEKSGDNPAFLTLWSVNRPGQYPVYSALGEGWASYCESTLSKDMGFFHQHSVGPLLQDLERDVYLVVDTGLHAMGWSVEQAAEFITNNTVLKANSSMELITRYITLPGQVLSYRIGQLTLERLRRTVALKLGPDQFRLPEFHEHVFQCYGTLALMEECVLRRLTDS